TTGIIGAFCVLRMRGRIATVSRAESEAHEGHGGTGLSNDKATNGEATHARRGAANDRIEYVSISQETRKRYLNYALSVISSRALPDARDGLKPVQRRILFAMHDGLHLTADGKNVKCMKICGETIGNYHPHGDIACYEALVRMAQDFALRYALVWGEG